MLSPQDALKKWQSGMQQGGANYTIGINAYQGNPGQAAADQKSAYVAGVNQSQDIWEQQMRNMDPAFWKQRCTTVGAQRLQEAATKSAPRMGAFLQKFLPFVQNAKSQLPKRGPKGSNNARAAMMADILHAARGQFRVKGQTS
jgi:hypothetical protein